MGDADVGIAVWPFHWLTTLPGALPPSLISATQFPKLFAYIDRFNQAVKAAAANKAPKISGPEVLSLISSAPALAASDVGVWSEEAEGVRSGLKQGDEVRLWPIDSGVKHKDYGTLVKLDGQEVVIERDLGEGGKGRIRIHAPRHGFRVSKLEGVKL